MAVNRNWLTKQLTRIPVKLLTVCSNYFTDNLPLKYDWALSWHCTYQLS